MRTIVWTHDCDGDGCDCDAEHAHELPATRVVCRRCDGEGRVLNPALGQHAYSSDEFEREFGSDGETDYRAEYRKGGRGIYGVECPDCRGEKVVDVVDLTALREADAKLADRYRRHLRAEASYRHLVASEVARGC